MIYCYLGSTETSSARGSLNSRAPNDTRRLDLEIFASDTVAPPFPNHLGRLWLASVMGLRQCGWIELEHVTRVESHSDRPHRRSGWSCFLGFNRFGARYETFLPEKG